MYWLFIIITAIAVDLIIVYMFNHISKFSKVNQGFIYDITPKGIYVRNLIQVYLTVTMTISDVFLTFLEKDIYNSLLLNPIFEALFTGLFWWEIILFITSIPKVISIRKDYNKEINHKNKY